MRAQTIAVGAALGGTALLARKAFARLNEVDLGGRSVLIVGASRGLGLLLARRFAQQGARVAICARDEDELERARQWLGGYGHDVLALSCDAGDERQVRALVDQVEARLGPIDVLVNNAAIMQVGEISQMTIEDFRRAHASTFWAAVHPTLAVLPGMRARRSGRIVNVTSIGGRLPGPHLTPYTAAKFATVGFSQVLRAELARDSIAVTTVVPWFMRTGSYLNASFKEPAEAEFTWFALGASLPLLSVDAEAAAARIVRAARRGEAEVTIGLPAWLASRFAGLFPGLTADIAGLFNRFLPRAGAPAQMGGAAGGARGEVLEAAVPSFVDVLTTLGRQAADRLNERRGPGPEQELRAQEELLPAGRDS